MKIADVSILSDGKEIMKLENGFSVMVYEKNEDGSPRSFEIKTPENKIYNYCNESRDYLRIIQAINNGSEERHYILDETLFDNETEF